MSLWHEALTLGIRADVVLRHVWRGEQSPADIARNNAHDAAHHAWDIARSVGG